MTAFKYLTPGYTIGMGVWIVAGSLVLVWLLRLRRAHRGRSTRALSALLSLWVLLALLTGAEIAFALFADFTDSISLTNVSRRWFRIHVQPNASGYRDGPLQLEPPTGVVQIAFLGDSFTLGHGIEKVDDRFSDLVAAELERLEPGQFQVANLGILGADVKGVGRNLDQEMARGFRPHTAVYVFCLNDIERMDRESTDAHFWEIGASRPKSFLFRDTYFLNFLYFRARQFQLAGIRDYFGFLRGYYAPSRKSWGTLVRNLDQLSRSTRRRGIALRMVIFPFVHYRRGDYPFADAHQQLVDYCADRSIPCLDLLPVLEADFNAGLAVNPFDAHPNERAHALAAGAITPWLLESR